MQPQLIAGRYQVLRAIGRGGMGTVWLCRDEVLGREVAVKQIGALPGESAPETKRAMREARSAAALNHPNAVAVFDVVDHDGRPWLVMEYVDGQTLADEISREGRLSPQRVADIGAQLAGALARAHERRIVHRDIKPGNVLLDKAGRPKISDFGIARGHGDEQLTQIGFITGTPGYLSPELARGGDPHPATDVWALGATLYSAVEGQMPYEPRSNPIALLRAIASERPRPMRHAGALGPAIDAMMHEDPEQRWDMATCARRLGGIARITMVMPRPDPARTMVIPVPPPLPTGPPNATHRLEAAAPAPVTPDPLAETRAAEIPAVEAIVAKTPAVETPQSVRPRPPGPPAVIRTPLATPSKDRSSVRRWLPLGLVALVVAVLGVTYFMSKLNGPANTTASRTTTSVTATPTATAESKTSAPPTTTATSAPQRVTPTPTPAPTPSPTPTAPPAEQKPDSFVRSYYAEVTGDTGRTWAQLTPTMQNRARGRSGYDNFWSGIARVNVHETQVNATGTSAIVKLTFVTRDGNTSTESHQLTFVRRAGAFLIDSDTLIR